MPLTLANENNLYEVIHIKVGHTATNRFLEMGLIPGVRLKVICNAKGPVIISINGTKYAIGKGLASKIIIREV